MRCFFNVIDNNESCVICGKKTLLLPLCKTCRSKYFSIEHSIDVKRCRYCGKELISEKEVCLQCREKPVIIHCDFVMPLFSYRLWNKELMFLWKSMEIRSLSDFFASLVYKALKKLGVSSVIPVPPRPGKIKEKGWDQIDELCSILKFRYGIVVLKLLERRNSQQQKKLDRTERLETIGKSYFPVSKRKMNKELERVKGVLPEEVCLIDDVCTTGATLESCGDVLKKEGVKTVRAITLFVVD